MQRTWQRLGAYHVVRQHVWPSQNPFSNTINRALATQPSQSRSAASTPATKSQPSNLSTSTSPQAPSQPSQTVTPAPVFAPIPQKSGDGPQPLQRPIGLPHAPLPGENSGVDSRTWRQRRDDFTNYDKHLAKRASLTKKIAKPYFREWTSMKHYEGKTFLAPPALFKGAKALYFPNLQGRTLSGDKAKDLCGVLAGKVSVVSLFSSVWAEKQVASFLSKENNPALHTLLSTAAGPGAEQRAEVVQRVHINVEEDALKYGLIRLFMGNLKKKVDKEEWDRYFIVRKGLSDDIRQTIGAINGKVGYVYLVDRDSRIRWAGCGPAGDDEKGVLVKGVAKLMSEAKESPTAVKTDSVV
jgi:ATPase complex subunit ATP10